VTFGPICVWTSSGYRRCDCGLFGVGSRAVCVVYRLVSVPRDSHAGANRKQLAIIGLLPPGTLRENAGDGDV
jgi:hypothetical protein